MRSLQLLLIACIAATSLGCGLPIPLPGDDDGEAAVKETKKKPKPRPKKAPPVGEWQKYSSTLEFPEKKGSSASTPSVALRMAYKDYGSLEISASRMPGAKIQLGEHTLEVPRSGSGTKQIDFREQLSLVALEEIKKSSRKAKFDLTVKVELANHKPMESDVPEIYVGRHIGDWLATVQNGALLFPGETAPAEKGKPHVAVIVKTGSGVRDVVGSGGTLRDVDWVVVRTSRENGSKKCGGYDLGSITLKLYDADVTIYDRRSGEQLSEKSFRATGSCPRTAYVGKDRTSTSSASASKIKRWVSYKLTGRSGVVNTGGSRRSRRRKPSFGQLLR